MEVLNRTSTALITSAHTDGRSIHSDDILYEWERIHRGMRLPQCREILLLEYGFLQSRDLNIFEGRRLNFAFAFAFGLQSLPFAYLDYAFAFLKKMVENVADVLVRSSSM